MKSIAFRTLFGALAAGLLMTGSLQAQTPPPPTQPVRLDVPVESPGIPIYVRLGRQGAGWQVPRNADWTAIIFYRDPACIPAGFDLANALDLPGPEGPGAFGCQPLIEGFDLRLATLDPMLPPDYMYMRNSTHDFPIWFVSTTELEVLLARGFVYLGEIEALPSRVAGQGWQFEEQLTPYGPNNPVQGIRISARGALETGGQFKLYWYYRVDVPNPFDQSSAVVLEDVFELESDLPSTKTPGRPANLPCSKTQRPAGCRD